MLGAVARSLLGLELWSFVVPFRNKMKSQIVSVVLTLIDICIVDHGQYKSLRIGITPEAKALCVDFLID